MTTYIDLVASLQLPTVEETERLSEEVVRNDDWREGLSLASPGRRLVFYLSPHAGEAHTGGPEAYRERFGCWDYDVACGAPPLVRDAGGNPVVIPEFVAEFCGMPVSDSWREGPTTELAASVRATLTQSRGFFANLRAVVAMLGYAEALAEFRGWGRWYVDELRAGHRKLAARNNESFSERNREHLQVPCFPRPRDHLRLGLRNVGILALCAPAIGGVRDTLVASLLRADHLLTDAREASTGRERSAEDSIYTGYETLRRALASVGVEPGPSLSLAGLGSAQRFLRVAIELELQEMTDDLSFIDALGRVLKAGGVSNA